MDGQRESWKGSSQKTIRSARRAFDSFREEMTHTRPDLLWAPQEWGADLAMSLHNEVTFMCFARWLMEGGLAASTVTTYLSLTRSSLEAELGFKLLSGQERGDASASYDARLASHVLATSEASVRLACVAPEEPGGDDAGRTGVRADRDAASDDVHG